MDVFLANVAWAAVALAATPGLYILRPVLLALVGRAEPAGPPGG